MTTDQEVLFEKRGSIGLITLNRPKALNSLTHAMALAIHKQLDAWKDDDAVCAVVVVGAGDRAFCAGGDVVKVSQAFKTDDDSWSDFFYDEYLMNIAIDEFPKPYVSLVDGFAMGGGVGVSIPGDYWVATEKTVFAMPETGLGLIPDVGGGWFLPRMPGEVGMYLALTGARMKAADLHAFGLATHVVASDKIEALVDALAAASISCVKCVKRVLDDFHNDPEPAPLAAHADEIDDLFGGWSVEDIMAGLKENGSDWCMKQYKFLLTKSPLSMKISYEQLRRGETLTSFRENMKMEWRVVSRIAAQPDFHEGVRAILLDKDNSPKWAHTSVADISEDEVAAYFQPVDKELEI